MLSAPLSRGESSALYEAILAAEDDLIDEMGEVAGRPVVNEARDRLPVLSQRRRILAAACKA